MLYILISVICVELIKNLKILINVLFELLCCIFNFIFKLIVCDMYINRCMIGNLLKLCYNIFLCFKDLE